MAQRFLKFVLLLAFVAGAPQNAWALSSKPRVLFMTSSYGVMLGALAGFATLAFYNDPSPHTRNVALGASLGLYSGIFLGVYMLYLKGDPNAKEAAPSGEESLYKLNSQIYASNSRALSLPGQSISPNDIVISPYLTYDSQKRVPTFGLSTQF